MPDILEELGHLALGSRLKRLAERMQADALKIHEQAGLKTQPSHFPLLTALDRYGHLTVNEAVDALGVSQPAVTRCLNNLLDLGLVKTETSKADRRQKTISLSAAGQDAVHLMKETVFPGVARAAAALCAGPPTDFLDHLKRIEDAMDHQSLLSRATQTLSIVDYTDELAPLFYSINEEWVSDMFQMEDTDERVLSDPKRYIIDKGGKILFVEAAGLGIVGTCALMPIEPGVFELTKMGVLASARGRKAGEFLLENVLERARDMEMDELFLLTNKKCEAAIHLYEKLGFEHNAEIMRRFGSRYERCDVAMAYDLGTA
ncbi:MAG: GNAT family N-acetyltransferase [Henriciella sp.]|nr:GNAT family N-acetyltransferase [Henriciella sp.]